MWEPSQMAVTGGFKAQTRPQIPSPYFKASHRLGVGTWPISLPKASSAWRQTDTCSLITLCPPGTLLPRCTWPWVTSHSLSLYLKITPFCKHSAQTSSFNPMAQHTQYWVYTAVTLSWPITLLFPHSVPGLHRRVLGSFHLHQPSQNHHLFSTISGNK